MGKVILIGKSKLIVLAMLATIPMFGALNGQLLVVFMLQLHCYHFNRP